MNKRSTILLNVLVSIALLGTFGSAQEADDQNKPETMKRWYHRIQHLGSQFQPGETTAQTELRRSQFVEQVKQQFDGRKLIFKSKVANVNWKDGIASIQIEAELPFGAIPTEERPLKLNRIKSFDIKLTREAAASIQKGMSFEILATMTFHPYQWGAVGPANDAQQLYSIRHKYLRGNFLGTFTTNTYRIKIAGKEVQPVWGK